MKVIRRIQALLREWRDGVNPPVFFAAAAFNVALILFAGLWTDTARIVFQATLTFITETFLERKMKSRSIAEARGLPCCLPQEWGWDWFSGEWPSH
jgi:uncharacterized membrane protein YjjP (DUF1212 family)